MRTYGAAMPFAPPAIGRDEIDEVVATLREGLWMTTYESSMFLHDSHVSLPAYTTRVPAGAVA